MTKFINSEAHKKMDGHDSLRVMFSGYKKNQSTDNRITQPLHKEYTFVSFLKTDQHI